MKTTQDLKQRIESIPMLGSERAHVLQSYVAAEAIVEALFAVGGWISRAMSSKLATLEKHAVSH